MRSGLDALRVCAGSRLGQPEGAQFFSLCQRQEIFLLLLLRPKSQDRIATEGSMGGDNDSCRRTALRKLFHTHDIGQRITALSAVLLRDRNPHKPVVLHLSNRFLRKTMLFVCCNGKRLRFFLGELPE